MTIKYVGRRVEGVTFVEVYDETGGLARITPLRHYIRHSPTGLEWGYGGSGPADTARSILIDALGADATCDGCNGAGEVVVDGENERAATPEERRRYRELAAAGDPEGDLLMRCMTCDGDGVRRVPYMDFKFEVIAKLPRESFELERAAVLDWLRARLEVRRATGPDGARFGV